MSLKGVDLDFYQFSVVLVKRFHHCFVRTWSQPGTGLSYFTRTTLPVDDQSQLNQNISQSKSFLARQAALLAW